MRIKGTAVVIGDDIDTDQIIAGRYLRTKDRSIWAGHVFEDYDPGIGKRLMGSVIIAGKNFGCGSSREQAVIALKEAGVRAVVAPSFARIFFRNAINIGLPVVEGVCECQDDADVTIDIDEGVVECGHKKTQIRPLSHKMQEILRAGGLVPLWRSRNR
jgi:methanogen homoaconitase small subunit